MSLTIENPLIEARLRAFATARGTTVDEAITALLDDETSEGIDVKLRQWQKADGSPLRPDASARTLFDLWKAEDADATDEERRRELALWTEIEAALMNQKGLEF